MKRNRVIDITFRFTKANAKVKFGVNYLSHAYLGTMSQAISMQKQKRQDIGGGGSNLTVMCVATADYHGNGCCQLKVFETLIMIGEFGLGRLQHVAVTGRRMHAEQLSW